MDLNIHIWSGSMSIARAGLETSPARVVLLLLIAVAAFTVFWLGLNLTFPELRETGIPSTVIRLAIHTTILTGLWLGLARTDLPYGTRARIWLALAVPFTVWLAIIWSFAL